MIYKTYQKLDMNHDFYKYPLFHPAMYCFFKKKGMLIKTLLFDSYDDLVTLIRTKNQNNNVT